MRAFRWCVRIRITELVCEDLTKELEYDALAFVSATNKEKAIKEAERLCKEKISKVCGAFRYEVLCCNIEF